VEYINCNKTVSRIFKVWAKNASPLGLPGANGQRIRVDLNHYYKIISRSSENYFHNISKIGLENLKIGGEGLALLAIAVGFGVAAAHTTRD